MRWELSNFSGFFFAQSVDPESKRPRHNLFMTITSGAGASPVNGVASSVSNLPTVCYLQFKKKINEEIQAEECHNINDYLRTPVTQKKVWRYHVVLQVSWRVVLQFLLKVNFDGNIQVTSSILLSELRLSCKAPYSSSTLNLVHCLRVFESIAAFKTKGKHVKGNRFNYIWLHRLRVEKLGS